jgi:hypothetical protein
MSRTVWLAMGIACLLNGAAGANELTAEGIRSALVGNSIRWWAEDTLFEGEVVFAPDGRAEITSENPPSADRGQWRLAGDQLCTTWRVARGGSEKCYRIRQVAQRRFVTTGGNVFEVLEPGA